MLTQTPLKGAEATETDQRSQRVQRFELVVQGLGPFSETAINLATIQEVQNARP
jgi:hypothetical protein